MLNYEFPLSLSHVGLGTLTETVLLNIFAESQLQALTHGKDTNLWTISGQDGRTLYPAWYLLDLTVPKEYLLNTFKLTDLVTVEAEVKSYGGMLLESAFAIRHQNLSKSIPDLNPKMTGGNLFIVKSHSIEPEIGIPKPGLLNELPKLASEPSGLKNFREMRRNGLIAATNEKPLSFQTHYKVCHDRDAAADTNVMFSKYVQIMDSIEDTYLREALFPPMPIDLIGFRQTLERRIYYFGNCKAGDSLKLCLTGSIKPVEPAFHGTRNDIVSLGLVNFEIEVYHELSNELLVASTVKKLFLSPSSRQSLIREGERVMRKSNAKVP